MTWWQQILVGLAIVVGAYFAGDCHGKDLQRANDETEWAQAAVKYDSTIAELLKPLPAVRETTFVEHTKWRDDPAARVWAESTVAAAKGDAARLALEVYELSVDRYADTNLVQRDSTPIGPVVYRSDIHQEYSPRAQRFIFDLHNSMVQFPELKQTGIKTMLIKPAFWEKPLGVLGGAAAGYGAARGDVAVAAVGGAAALISLVIDF